ncbi:hypothetical protein OF850_12355, partial [Roseococcus sp. MDT2-1-1]|nr:hypothetical protein [Roseococcus sp. MDT2-1-1]
MSLLSLPALGAGGIVALSLENAGAQTLKAGIATLGQVFKQGDVPNGTSLVAQIGGKSVALQVDVKSTWPDGSAKMTVLSFARPDIAPGADVGVVIAKGTAAAGPAVDLAKIASAHSFTVDYAPTGGASQTIDVMAALKAALANGTASFWQQGVHATQARVEVPVGGSMRMVFDVTGFANGEVSVDATFANDIAMSATGGAVNYSTTIRLDGAVVHSGSLTQGQYQRWHKEFASSESDGGQSIGGPAKGWLNIVHDISYLEKSGAVAAYDLSIPVAEARLAAWHTATQAPTWNAPLAANGVTQNFPQTGGRDDLGMLTAANTAWVISQDVRAATYALGQAEAASAVPWHFWDAKNGTWVNTDNYPKLWTDSRYGAGTDTTSTATKLTQLVGSTGWNVDRAHQPELSFFPYVQTGERWIYDNLMSQAASNIIGTWPGPRSDALDLVVNGGQVRSSAWSLRELENAAFVAAEGSPEKAYLQAAADANWKWLVSKIPEWTKMQGEAHGWIPGDYGNSGNMGPWQQDYFASTSIAAASRGSADALTFLKWQENFLIGRFLQANNGFAQNDGAAYNIAITDPATGRIFTTWAEIGAQTVARNLSNGTGWTNSQGEYARLAMATLAGIYELTGNQTAADIYKALIAAKAPWTSLADYSKNLNYAVTLPGVYSEVSWSSTGTGSIPVVTTPTPAPTPAPAPTTPTAPAPAPTPDTSIQVPAGNTVASTAKVTGTSRDDAVTLSGVANGITVDLGSGRDALTLSSAGPNTLVVFNTEVIKGGSQADTVMLGTAISGGTIDLGGGRDTLRLANGSNQVTVANVEVVHGGTGADIVTFSTAAVGATIDLGAGSDRLILSSAGPNTVTVLNTEVITGGSQADTVTLGAATTNAVIDLGAGNDRLVLANGTNTVTVSNVETVIGGTGVDTVILAPNLSHT